MALVVYQAQRCYSSLSCPRVRRKVARLKASVSFHLTRRACKLVSSRYIRPWSSKPILSKKERGFEVSSFKGNSWNGAEGTEGRLRSWKTCIRFSVPRMEREEVVTESPNRTIRPLTVYCNDAASGSPAIKSLFKKLLALLWSNASSVKIDEPHSQMEKSAHVDDPGAKEFREHSRNLLKAAVLRVWVLDATIKLPLLIFPPFYLAVRVAYGMEVAMELMPLWVLGPLIVALYIVLIRGIMSCYIFCFKLSKKFIINLPRYYSFVHEGKLKAYLRSHLWQPIEDIKNMDYKELSIQKLKQLMGLAKEKRLDLVESIWPYYCRTIRFLKRANLI